MIYTSKQPVFLSLFRSGASMRHRESFEPGKKRFSQDSIIPWNWGSTPIISLLKLGEKIPVICFIGIPKATLVQISRTMNWNFNSEEVLITDSRCLRFFEHSYKFYCTWYLGIPAAYCYFGHQEIVLLKFNIYDTYVLDGMEIF